MEAILPEYVQWLLDEKNYPHPVEYVELIQTHISYVILAGDFVYKFKKPVDFRFLNFTSLDRRKFYCEEELRLNRRLCPKIYLDTVAVCKGAGGFAWDRAGQPVEYAVKMRRLAEDRMMGRVIARGELQQGDILRITDKLIPFYETADRSGRVRGYGDVGAVARTIQDNFRETRPFAGGNVLPEGRFNSIRRYATRFLEKEQLFVDRANEDKICEGHGDLHSGNICLEDEVAIFDCIEFNESLRCTDIAADLAFLAMDLDYHGLRSYRDIFIDSYIERSGDRGMKRMLAFYMCYRAYVRGKIGLLTSADNKVAEDVRTRAEESARRYFRLSEEYGEQFAV